MEYPRAEKYERLHTMIMGPNPLKLTEELLEGIGLKETAIKTSYRKH